MIPFVIMAFRQVNANAIKVNKNKLVIRNLREKFLFERNHLCSKSFITLKRII